MRAPRSPSGWRASVTPRRAQRLETRHGVSSGVVHTVTGPIAGGAGGIDGAFDQARLQPRRAGGAQHRNEPRLGEACHRRLRQHRDRDRLSRAT